MKSEICNIADDTAIYACDTSVEAVLIRLDGDIHRLMQWFTDKSMKANASRFQIMFLGQRDMSKLFLNIKGHLIPSSNQVKLLGVKIYNSLKFEVHVKKLCRKVNLKVHAFCKIKTIFRRAKVKANIQLRDDVQFFIPSSNLAILYQRSQ